MNQLQGDVSGAVKELERAMSESALKFQEAERKVEETKKSIIEGQANIKQKDVDIRQKQIELEKIKSEKSALEIALNRHNATLSMANTDLGIEKRTHDRHEQDFKRMVEAQAKFQREIAAAAATNRKK